MNLLKSINEYIGRYISLLIILMVLVQIFIVISRYIFGLGFIKLQELMIYMHGILFTLAAGYTLLHDEHVRVDSFYRESSIRFKSVVNFFGTLTFLLPFILTTFFMSYPMFYVLGRFLKDHLRLAVLMQLICLKQLWLFFHYYFCYKL